MAERTQPWADAAFRAFYERHSAYLYKVCSRCARSLNGEIWIEDVFNDTFARAYEKAGQFELPEGAPATDEENFVRAWLGKIASNFIRQKVRKFGREENQSDVQWEPLASEAALWSSRQEATVRENSAEGDLINSALASLTEREQLVLRVTFQYHRTGEKFQRLPNKVSQDLAEALATTPENLRKIRERALAKVRQYVHQTKPRQPRSSA